MKARRKQTAEKRTAQEASAPAVAPWSIVSIIAVILCAGYLIAYFLTSLDAPQFQNLTRGSLWQLAVLPDVVVHGWLPEDHSFAILDRVPILFGAAAFHIAAFAVGTLALRALRWSRNEKLEWFLLAHGLGLSVVSLATLLVGLAGGLQQRWFLLGPWLVAVVASAAIYCRVPKSEREAAAIPRVADTNDWLSPHWLWLTAPFVAFLILGGALPPIEFDVREYHLQAPKEFFQLGRIEFLPHNVYANMPLGAEMWPLAAMSITGDWWLGALVGKTVIASLLPFTAAALYVLGVRLGSRTAGIVAAIVYLTFPWMLQVSMFGLIDGAVAFYVALALLVLFGRGDDAEAPIASHVLAGLFAGSAAACKYPALLFVVAPVVAAIGWNARRQGPKCVARQIAIAMLAAAVVMAPWLLKNWHFTGNPVYPLLDNVFETITRTAETSARWREAHRPHGFGPITLFDDVRRVLLDSMWQSPIVWPLIGCGLLSLFAGKRHDPLRGATRWLALFATFVFVCWWLFTHRIDRFWLPAVPALALLAGWGAACAGDRLARWCILGAISIGTFWSLLWVTSPLVGECRYFAPIAQLRVAPDRVDPWNLELNRRGGRTLVIGEAAVFDFESPVLYNTTFDPSWLERYGVNDPRAPESLAGFDKLVQENAIEYVYVDWDEVARYRAPGNYGFDPRVTPELFQELLTSNRLLPPLPAKEGSRGTVYPVRK